MKYIQKMKRARRLLILSVALCSVTAVYGQDPFEEYRKEARKDYDDFAQKARDDYDNFRDKANAEYAGFMKEPWKPVDVQPSKPVPPRPEPVTPPVKNPGEEEAPPEELPFEEVIPMPVPRPVPQPVEPILAPKQPVGESFAFDFYNTPCKVRLGGNQKYKLASVSEKAVGDVWKRLSGSDYNPLISDCLRLRQQMILCDWAYVNLLQQLTTSYFGALKGNEAVVMQMFILTQSGYKVRIARSEDNRLMLLLPSDYTIYRYKFLRIDGKSYYIINPSIEGKLYVFDHAYPKEQLFSIRIDRIPRLAAKDTERRTLASKAYPQLKVDVCTNKNLIDFYNNYPISANWDAYSRASLSEEVKRTLYPALKREIAGQSESEAANILINFVQTAFEYATDDEQFGYERPLFADETIFYPFSDCEDRAIFYSILVRELLGLQVVLLNYPGHLATAVHFNSEVRGDYLMVDGAKFLVCDPTYINAAIGFAMPQFKTTKCIVVKI